MRHFLEWIENEYRLPLRTAQEVDEALAEYGWWVYENWGGRGKWRLNMATFGVEHYMPELEKQLHLARRSLQGWSNLRPPLSHSPLNWALACLIASELNTMGHPGMAIAVVLGFDCYLRISEIANLRACDVTDILLVDQEVGRAMEQSGKGTSTLVTLPHTKTGMNQSVCIRRPVVEAKLLNWVRYVTEIRSRGARAKLFPDPPTFRRLFYQAQVNLGWQREDGSVPFVPHSLRHGGAAGDFLRHPTRLEEILFRGRWASIASTRHYIQTGPALMAAAAVGVPAWQREFANLVGQAVRYYIQVPDFSEFGGNLV